MNVKNEIIEFLDNRIDPEFFVTIPLNSYFQRVDEVKKSRLIFQLLTRVNRDIFTKKELRRFNKEIKCIPYTERHEDAIHLTIEIPECIKFADYDLKNPRDLKKRYLKIKQIFLKNIRKMNLSNIYEKQFIREFFKPITNPTAVHQYCQKRNVKNQISQIAETIDIANIRV